MKRVGIIAVCDFVSLPNGGEVFLLNNFLSAHSNNDIRYYLIGMTFDESVNVGEWNVVRIGSNDYNFFPVAKVLKDKEKTHIPFRFRIVAGIYKYWRKIIQRDIDEVYIHSAELGIPFWNKRDVPVVYHVHGDPGQTLKYSRFVAFRGSWWTNMYYGIIRRTIQKSSKVIWAANRSKDLYLKAQPQMKTEVEKKSCVIHSSFDTKLEVKKETILDLPARIHLITVARLAKIKRIDFLIDCIKTLVNDEQDIDLLIVGEGEERDNLEKLAEELGIMDKVVFLGLLDREHIAKALNESEVFLFASENEAMSLVVLESLYMGVPVVSTDVGDIKDAVINDETGFTIDGYNKKAYVQRIKEILLKGKSHYSDACKRMAANYTPEKMADSIDKVFLND